MTEYRVRHRTTYEYEVPVLHAHHLAHLRPRAVPYQTVLGNELTCEPKAHAAHRFRDYFGNETDAIEVLERHDTFTAVVASRIEVRPRPLSVQSPLTPLTWSEARAWLQSAAAPLDAIECVCDSPLVRHHGMFKEYAGACFGSNRSLVDSVLELNQRIFEDFAYDPTSTDVSTPLAQVMRERRGVCQDFAHVLIACLRTFGLAARYVSGYLETEPPEGQEKLQGADASHAWAAVLIPDHGWLELDPTNGILPTERHITLAWGRDFSDVTPFKGVVLGGGRHQVIVGVDVIASDGEPPSSRAGA